MPVHFLDRVHRPASGPVAVGIVLEVSLEDRLDHDLGGSLNHTITNGRNAKRTLHHSLWGSSPAAPDQVGTSSRPVPRASPPTMLPGPTPRCEQTSSHPHSAHPH